MRLFRIHGTKEVDYSTIVMADSPEQAQDIADAMETTELTHWDTWDICSSWEANGGESFDIYDIDDTTGNTMRKIKKITDHELASLLRKYGAIDNYTKEGNTNKWQDNDGRLIAIAFYDNSRCLTQVYLPDYVIWDVDTVIKEITPKKNRSKAS